MDSYKHCDKLFDILNSAICYYKVCCDIVEFIHSIVPYFYLKSVPLCVSELPMTKERQNV